MVYKIKEILSHAGAIKLMTLKPWSITSEKAIQWKQHHVHWVLHYAHKNCALITDWTTLWDSTVLDRAQIGHT